MDSESKDAPRVEKILSHQLTKDVIDEAVGNWTQNRRTLDPTVVSALCAYATAVATKILGAEAPYPDFSSPEWKGSVADKAYEILDFDEFVKEHIPIIVEQLQPKYGDTTHEFDGLWGYSLAKIANTVGCVASMIANDLDPNLLRMTDKEGQEHMQKMVDMLSEKMPNEVLVFDPSIDTPQDVIDEITVRTNPPDISDLFKKD